MRWVTYTPASGATQVGVLVDDRVHAARWDGSLLELLEQDSDLMSEVGEAARRTPRDVQLVADVTLTLPFRPRTIRDGAGFLQHLRNNARVLGNDLDPRFNQYPPFYFGNAAAAVGPDADIHRPPDSERLDFELEIGAVIGRSGRDIPVSRAMEHVAGFLIFCDWSARDLQMAERGLFGQMKGKDFANSIGPALVTPDEIAAFRRDKGYELRMTAHVNGDQITDGVWSDVDWDFPDMIAFASRGVSLFPGEVIGSGTVPSGCLFESFSHEPDHFRGWLQPGDEVVLHVEELGELRHRVADGGSAQRLTSGY